MADEKFYEIEQITPYFVKVTEVKIEEAMGNVYSDDERKDFVDGWATSGGYWSNTYVDVQTLVAEVRKHLSANVRNKRFPIPSEVTIDGHDSNVQSALNEYGYTISLGFIKPLTAIVRKAKPTDGQRNRFRARLAYRFKYLLADRFGIHCKDLEYVFNNENDLKFASACHKLGVTFDDLIINDTTFMTCFTSHKDTHTELMSIIKPEFAAKFEQAKTA